MLAVTNCAVMTLEPSMHLLQKLHTLDLSVNCLGSYVPLPFCIFMLYCCWGLVVWWSITTAVAVRLSFIDKALLHKHFMCFSSLQCKPTASCVRALVNLQHDILT